MTGLKKILNSSLLPALKLSCPGQVCTFLLRELACALALKACQLRKKKLRILVWQKILFLSPAN